MTEPGIDSERVRDKALRMGLISRDQARAMTDQQVKQLIFSPGLSTAERITDISGRGVGMDVVKTNIERIGGSVEIDSRVGQGTTLRVKIPLTLAIIPALIVVTRWRAVCDSAGQRAGNRHISADRSGSRHGDDWQRPRLPTPRGTAPAGRSARGVAPSQSLSESRPGHSRTSWCCRPSVNVSD